MPHPLIPVSLPPASVTMAMSQMNHLSTIANMAAAAQVQSPPSRVETSVIKVTNCLIISLLWNGHLQLPSLTPFVFISISKFLKSQEEEIVRKKYYK